MLAGIRVVGSYVSCAGIMMMGWDTDGGYLHIVYWYTDGVVGYDRLLFVYRVLIHVVLVGIRVVDSCVSHVVKRVVVLEYGWLVVMYRVLVYAMRVGIALLVFMYHVLIYVWWVGIHVIDSYVSCVGIRVVGMYVSRVGTWVVGICVSCVGILVVCWDMNGWVFMYHVLI